MQLSNISPIFRVCSVMVARDIWVIEEAFESHIFYCTVSVSGLARKSVDLQGRVRVAYRTFEYHGVKWLNTFIVSNDFKRP